MLYEMHVKGFTQLNHSRTRSSAGQFFGRLRCPRREYLRRLGVRRSSCCAHSSYWRTTSVPT